METRTFLYRIQIHRRTLLGSGAFAGLGALLAACGQQANNEAAATASDAPSESAPATVPAASESPSAECHSVYCSRLFGRLEGA